MLIELNRPKRDEKSLWSCKAMRDARALPARTIEMRAAENTVTSELPFGLGIKTVNTIHFEMTEKMRSRTFVVKD